MQLRSKLQVGVSHEKHVGPEWGVRDGTQELRHGDQKQMCTGSVQCETGLGGKRRWTESTWPVARGSGVP